MPHDRPYPAPFDASTFIVPAEWHAFSDLLGGAETGLLVLREGRVAHLNTHLAERLGFDESELIGMPVDSLFPPDKTSASGNGRRGHAAIAEGSVIALRSKGGGMLQFEVVENRIDVLTDARCTIWVLRPLAPRTDDAAAYADTRFQAIADELPDPVLVHGSGGSYANKAFRAAVGGRDDAWIDLVHPDDRAEVLAALERPDGGDDAAEIGFRVKNQDGSWRHLVAHVRNLSSHPDIGGLLISAHDVTGQLQRQQEIATSKRRQLHYLNRLLRMAQKPHPNLASALTVIVKAAAKALGSQHCMVWEVGDTSAATRCVMAYDDVRQNYAAVPVPDAVLTTALHPLLQSVLREERALVAADVDQDVRVAAYCEYFHAASIKAALMVPVPHEGDTDAVLILADSGQARQWHKDEAEFADHVAQLLALFFTEAERSKKGTDTRPPAHRDALTGLPNRDFLLEQAGDVLPALTAKANTAAAFFIDLDGFKKVNDTLGHETGDELLKAAAMRLKHAVRKNDILVRLGGDEFMLLARNLSDMRVADDIAAQIVESMRGTFSLQGRELQVSASVGIAIYPFDGTDIDTLMKKADIAMYHAKSAGRDQYQMFASRFDGGLSNRTALESDLRRAIEQRELQHYYQPQIDLHTGEVRCVEALLRWIHPQHGLLLPASFLPLAEESGLIHQISAWVLNDACAQLAAWNSKGLGGFNVAINLSGSQLMDRALLAELEQALERSGIASHRLEWEIKESTVMQHHTMAASILERAADLRIGLSIDDFGTGFSSMSYLQRYPVRKVKIDHSLVSGLPDEHEHRALIDAIISMARPLGLDVVAEGVETSPQIDYLREHGCNIAQGYYFTQPLTADQFETWLIRH